MASFIARFAKFLGKHSEEVNAAGAAMNIIAAYLPVPPGEKAVIAAAADKLISAGANIAASLDEVKQIKDAVPSAKEVGAAVKPALQDMVSAAVSAALAEYAKQQQQLIATQVSAAVEAANKANAGKQ